MAKVHMFEVHTKPAPVSLGQSWVKFNSCLITQASIVVKQWVSLLEPIVEHQCDLRVPIIVQQLSLGTQSNSYLKALLKDIDVQQ
jgi:hypothetical protein